MKYHHNENWREIRHKNEIISQARNMMADAKILYDRAKANCRTPSELKRIEQLPPERILSFNKKFPALYEEVIYVFDSLTARERRFIRRAHDMLV
jgi:hypothetical protein